MRFRDGQRPWRAKLPSFHAQQLPPGKSRRPPRYNARTTHVQCMSAPPHPSSGSHQFGDGHGLLDVDGPVQHSRVRVRKRAEAIWFDLRSRVQKEWRRVDRPTFWNHITPSNQARPAAKTRAILLCALPHGTQPRQCARLTDTDTAIVVTTPWRHTGADRSCTDTSAHHCTAFRSRPTPFTRPADPGWYRAQTRANVPAPHPCRLYRFRRPLPDY